MSEGEGNQVQFDATDQAYMQHQMDQGGWIAPVGALASTLARAADKATLAQSQSTDGSMRIDLDKVDELARFFDDEAQKMLDRADAVRDLSLVDPAGGDPVSTQTAPIYSQVASGGGSGYLENYLQLADLFAQTSATLRENTKQTRLDDQNSADSFGGGSLA
ncbi:hypothetical protein AB0L13_36245 [Saccharopolyspora shandongensis]|uniref:hypothetical protein n=1 Tax=Saccharopolyspora shandongensis TaxID=418495 RepID=UPI0034394BCB